jgi:hypothetical protein
MEEIFKILNEFKFLSEYCINTNYSPSKSLIPKTSAFFQTKKHTTDRSTERCCYAGGCATRDKITLFRV